MRDAARALDDVSDHLGEVLRHADQLLADWSAFGAQVRVGVEREVAAIGTVVDGAVARAASAGLDQAIADRLRALTTELERLEQRARTASRAVVEHRESDRRILWIVVAGVVLANALLAAVLLRRPVVMPVAEPVRVEAIAPPSAAAAPSAEPGQAPAVGTTPGSSDGAGATAAANAGDAAAAAPGGAGSSASGAGAGSAANVGAGSNAGSAAALAGPGGGSAARSGASSAAALPGGALGSGRPPPGSIGPAKPPGSSVSLPAKAGAVRPHKKLP